MSLRDQVLDLIGAEIQEHTVTVAGKSKPLRFRQFSDAVGRAIFAPGPEGQSAEDRGRQVMAGVVAASLLGPDGELAGGADEALALTSAVLIPLYEAAARTNNIHVAVVSQETAIGGEAAAGPKS